MEEAKIETDRLIHEIETKVREMQRTIDVLVHTKKVLIDINASLDQKLKEQRDDEKVLESWINQRMKGTEK